MKSEAFRDDLAACCEAPAVGVGALAAAFIPHEPDGVSFVEGVCGERYRRTCEAGQVRYDPLPVEPKFDFKVARPADFRADMWAAQTLTLQPSRVERSGRTVTLYFGSGGAVNYGTGARETYAARSDYGVLVDYERASDLPGIAAMAAKNVQPAPEPVLCVAGEQVTEREIAEALALLRGKNAPAVKETPRGLLTVAPMDHRLGRWSEA